MRHATVLKSVEVLDESAPFRKLRLDAKGCFTVTWWRRLRLAQTDGQSAWPIGGSSCAGMAAGPTGIVRPFTVDGLFLAYSRVLPL
jgi:hypothetical protein